MWVVSDQVELEIPLERVQTDDVVVVNAGQTIPVDGVIVRGIASIDQRMLTGEAQPAEKVTGDAVLTSTIVLSGKIYIRVEKTGAETVAAQIGHILGTTTDFREVIQSRADAYSGKLILPMLAMSGLALPLGGVNSATALFMNVPAYKMRYFGPMAMLNFLNIAARQGLLIKDGRSLEMRNRSGCENRYHATAYDF
ncbi:P-type ATPase [Candidatus Entotheonella palauensis]|uniref:P-type ATPase n=1 Tax=Candidatus Entotheonella palauensis TaxID=93172 RepID=UPI0015C4BED5|nr:hypothetical protein [Candidatus Entotheonella palauensis]